MTVPASTIADYAPWGNARLMFEVGTSAQSVDPSTGNVVTGKEMLSYLAALFIQSPNWKGEPGIDNTVYPCRGRLLSPARLDPRITNGSQAEAIVNGYRGRFELVFSLDMDAIAYRDVRQDIEGTFRVIGGPR